MEDSEWFVFGGGGTGGHLFPALSVVAALLRRQRPIDVSFFCTTRPIDREILGAAGIDAVPQGVLPFPAKPWRWPAFLLNWRRAVDFCMHRFSRRRPSVVVGAGGYASGPPVHAAGRLGIPNFLLNPDAVPGRANRHMAVTAGTRCVFAQWDVTRDFFPDSVPVEVTGCPVRPGFRQVPAHAVGPIRESFHLHPDHPTILVTGASQGARTLNEAMLGLAPLIATTGWQVLHLSGPADADLTEQAYRLRAPDLRFRVLAFTDRMPDAMAAADLIVSRAGASTLAEIQAVGRPSILFPYPYHRDQHQRHNAAVLADAGAAVLLQDARQAMANAARLGPVLALLMGDPRRRAEMTAAASGLHRADADVRIAERLLNP